MYVSLDVSHSISTYLAMTVTLGFFDDIYIPRIFLPEPSALYDPISFEVPE